MNPDDDIEALKRRVRELEAEAQLAHQSSSSSQQNDQNQGYHMAKNHNSNNKSFSQVYNQQNVNNQQLNEYDQTVEAYDQDETENIHMTSAPEEQHEGHGEEQDQGADQNQNDEEFISAKDDHSIYIGNLAYEVTPEQLQTHFSPCGVINRITIMCNKITGKPKGFAYMEFEDKESVDLALNLHETELNGRPLVVTLKRKNVPKFMIRGRGGRGGFRGNNGPSGGFRGGRGGFRGTAPGGFRGRGGGFRGGFRGAPRGAGGFRGRGDGRYNPY